MPKSNSWLEERILTEARLIAPNLEGRCRHISFLCIRNKILSVGWNSYRKTHQKAMECGALGNNIHSELSVIVHFPKNANIYRSSLYNVRIALNGDVRLSAPCKSCMKLIAAFGIRRVYYTVDGGGFERLF